MGAPTVDLLWPTIVILGACWRSEYETCRPTDCWKRCYRPKCAVSPTYKGLLARPSQWGHQFFPSLSEIKKKWSFSCTKWSKLMTFCGSCPFKIKKKILPPSPSPASGPSSFYVRLKRGALSCLVADWAEMLVCTNKMLENIVLNYLRLTGVFVCAPF